MLVSAFGFSLLISKGIRCSRTACFKNNVTAVVKSSPKSANSSCAVFLSSGSRLILVLTFAMLSPPRKCIWHIICNLSIYCTYITHINYRPLGKEVTCLLSTVCLKPSEIIDKNSRIAQVSVCFFRYRQNMAFSNYDILVFLPIV